MLIETSQEIDASAGAVWHVFGNGFAHIAEWAEMVDSAELDGPVAVGSVRSLEMKSGRITEQLTHFEPDAHALTYEVTSGLPPLIKSVVNAWQIESIGPDRSRISSRLQVQLAWWAVPLTPLMRMMFSKDLPPFLEQLSAHVAA